MKNFILFVFLGLVLTTGVASAQIDLDTVSDASLDNEKKDTKASSNNKNSVVDDALDLFGKAKKKKKKKKLTVDELKEKANAGDIASQLDLGYMYLYGKKGVNTDYKSAFMYYEMAADKNNEVALNNLGSLYFNGIGTDVNYSKALDYFDRAAQAGSADAAVNLAIIYLSKKSAKEQTDYQKVFQLLEQSKEKNNIAKYLIGYSYYIGFYYKQNIKKAFSLIKDVAVAGYDEAQFVLSDFYINGLGTPKNYRRAVQSLRAAAGQGHPNAIVKLADIYSEGKIYTPDIFQAHVLYNVAAVMGQSGAAEKRDLIEKRLRIEDLLLVQANAENFKPNPTELTSFIKKTFGNSLKIYIDSNISNGISAGGKVSIR